MEIAVNPFCELIRDWKVKSSARFEPRSPLDQKLRSKCFSTVPANQFQLNPFWGMKGYGDPLKPVLCFLSHLKLLTPARRRSTTWTLKHCSSVCYDASTLLNYGSMWLYTDTFKIHSMRNGNIEKDLSSHLKQQCWYSKVFQFIDIGTRNDTG